MKLPSWTPCFVDPVQFDCAECDIGDEPCLLRSDPTLRAFVSAQWRRRKYQTVRAFELEPAAAQIALESLREIVSSQGVSSTPAIAHARLPRELRESLTTTDVAALLAASSEFRQSSPGMFRKAGLEEDDPDGTSIKPGGPTSGAAIEELLAANAPLHADQQRLLLKRFAGLRQVGSFTEIENATSGLSQVIDAELAPVMREERWSLSRIHAFATDGQPVVFSHDDPISVEKRSRLLSAINGLELLVHGSLPELDLERVALRNRLVLANVRLVSDIAYGYSRGRFLEFGDLFHEGLFGLFAALDKFDPFRGFALSTYATPWIRQRVTRALADGDRTIRLPVHAVEELARMRRGGRYAELELDETRQTVEEVEEESFETEGDDDDEWSIDQLANDDAEELRRFRRFVAADTPPIPIDQVAEGRLADSRDVDDPFELAAVSQLSDVISGLLSTLTAREAHVLRRRFGLDDGRSRTLEEVGQDFNLTRERIRQIEAKALKKMRHFKRRRKIDSYL